MSKIEPKEMILRENGVVVTACEKVTFVPTVDRLTGKQTSIRVFIRSVVAEYEKYPNSEPIRFSLSMRKGRLSVSDSRNKKASSTALDVTERGYDLNGFMRVLRGMVGDGKAFAVAGFFGLKP